MMISLFCIIIEIGTSPYGYNYNGKCQVALDSGKLISVIHSFYCCLYG